MKKEDVMQFIGKALPFIGAAATGNVPALVAMAAKEIGDALGSKVEPTQAGIVQAVANATPAEFAAIRQAEQDFALKMRELGYKEATELAKLGVENTKDARAMQTATRSIIPGVLAVIIVAGFFIILVAMMLGHLKTSDQQALLILLGALSAGFGAVLNFYFGSSHGSQNKDALLANSVPAAKG
jgi:hypothetical protein